MKMGLNLNGIQTFSPLLVVLLTQICRGAAYDHFKHEAVNIVESAGFKGLRHHQQLGIVSERVIYAHPSDGGFTNIFENLVVNNGSVERTWKTAGLARLCSEDGTVYWLHQMAVQCGPHPGHLVFAKYERAAGTVYLWFDTVDALRLCKLAPAHIRAELTTAATNCATAFKQMPPYAEQMAERCTSVLHASTCQDVIDLVRKKKAVSSHVLMEPPVLAVQLLTLAKGQAKKGMQPCRTDNPTARSACEHILAHGIKSMGFDEVHTGDGSTLTLAILESGRRGFLYLLSERSEPRLLLTRTAANSMIRINHRRAGTLLQVSLVGPYNEKIEQQSFDLNCSALTDCSSCLSRWTLDRCAWCYRPHSNTGNCTLRAACKGGLPALRLTDTCPPIVDEVVSPAETEDIVMKGRNLRTSRSSVTRVGICGKSCVLGEVSSSSLACDKPSGLRRAPSTCPIVLYWTYQVQADDNSTIEVPVPVNNNASRQEHINFMGIGGKYDRAVLLESDGLPISRPGFVALVSVVCLIALLSLVAIIVLLRCRRHGCIWFGKVVDARSLTAYSPVDARVTEGIVEEPNGSHSRTDSPTSAASLNGSSTNATDQGQPSTYIRPSSLLPRQWHHSLSSQVAPNILIHHHDLTLCPDSVGEGNFGVVFKAKYRINDRVTTNVAVKTLHVGYECPVGHKRLQEFLREGLTMNNFRHPHVLHLIGISFTGEGIPWLVTPFMDNGDLANYVRGHQEMGLSQMMGFAQQIAAGMVYLHRQKFVHRDLACRNCMLEEDLVSLFQEMGLSQMMGFAQQIAAGMVYLHRQRFVHRDLACRNCMLEEDLVSLFQEMGLSQMMGFAQQIAAGMVYLHRQRFVHRDLACRNCMLEEDLVSLFQEMGLSQMMGFAQQIAAGMVYLHRQRFVHRDLACRNCMLEEDLVSLFQEMGLSQMMGFAQQIAAGMVYLHRQRFVHRDLACRNCMLEEDLVSLFQEMGLSQMMGFAQQIAAGMVYLHRQRFVHRDLACRNCMLEEDLVSLFQEMGLSQMMGFAQQIAAGMVYLHRQRFVHRDLACRNCMLEEDLVSLFQEMGLSQMMGFAQQIAAGMVYLHRQRFVHRDLACRNCMLEEDLVSLFQEMGLSQMMGFAQQIAAGMVYLHRQRFVHRDLACRNCMLEEDLVSLFQEMGLSQMMGFAQQIAAGMVYLHRQRFVHRDLACRNCMLDEDLVLKIADFGLCRDVYESEAYACPQQRRRGSMLPIRWMPLESIEQGRYDAKSDVWSYGVVLWEIVTHGKLPYSAMQCGEMLSFLKTGQRLPQPDNCPDEIYDLMRQCWSVVPGERPCFTMLLDRLAVAAASMDVDQPVVPVNYARLVESLPITSHDSTSYGQSCLATGSDSRHHGPINRSLQMNSTASPRGTEDFAPKQPDAVPADDAFRHVYHVPRPTVTSEGQRNNVVESTGSRDPTTGSAISGVNGNNYDASPTSSDDLSSSVSADSSDLPHAPYTAPLAQRQRPVVSANVYELKPHLEQLPEQRRPLQVRNLSNPGINLIQDSPSPASAELDDKNHVQNGIISSNTGINLLANTPSSRAESWNPEKVDESEPGDVISLDVSHSCAQNGSKVGLAFTSPLYMTRKQGSLDALDRHRSLSKDSLLTA